MWSLEIVRDKLYKTRRAEHLFLFLLSFIFKVLFSRFKDFKIFQDFIAGRWEQSYSRTVE